MSTWYEQRLLEVELSRHEMEGRIRAMHEQIRQMHNTADGLRAMMHDLAQQLGNALYSNDWRTREYGIAIFSTYEKLNPEHKRDLDEMVDQ